MQEISKQKTVRAFWAFDLPSEVKRNIYAFQVSLQKTYPDFRWVGVANIHLTLRFLGDILPFHLKPMADSFKALIEGKEFPSFSIGSLGTFPSWKNPRGLWFPLQGDLNILKEIHAQLEKVLKERGLELDKRPFTPHITIARIPNRDNSRDISNLKGVSLQIKQAFCFRSITLYRSELNPSGPKYTPIYSFPLTSDESGKG